MTVKILDCVASHRPGLPLPASKSLSHLINTIVRPSRSAFFEVLAISQPALDSLLIALRGTFARLLTTPTHLLQHERVPTHSHEIHRLLHLD